MDYKKQFVISFGGLSIGNHQFEFDIDDRFFEELDYSETKKGKVKVILTLEKQSRLLQLTFDISGWVETICDRCLDPVECPINGTSILFVKFGKDFEEQSEDVIVIPEKQTQFDVRHYIYEFISLLIPYRHIHPEDGSGARGCDPVVLKKLEELAPPKTIDPHWEVLKNLNNN